MDMQILLDAQKRQLEQELHSAYSQKASQEAKVADAASSTGNAAADRSLADGSIQATNTLAMIQRMIDTRENKIAEIQKQMDALNAAKPA